MIIRGELVPGTGMNIFMKSSMLKRFACDFAPSATLRAVNIYLESRVAPA